MLARDGAQLLGLAVDKVLGLLELVVNELLVGSVDQRSEEDNSGGNERKTPVRDNLDKVV